MVTLFFALNSSIQRDLEKVRNRKGNTDKQN